MIEIKTDQTKKEYQPEQTFSVKTETLTSSLLIKVRTSLSERKGVEYVKEIKNIDEEGKLGELFEKFSDVVDYLTNKNNLKFNEIERRLSIMIPHPKKKDQTIEFEKIELKEIEKTIYIASESTMGIIDRCACKQELTQDEIKGMFEKLANAVEDAFSKIENSNKKYESIEESLKLLTVKIENIENSNNINKSESTNFEETNEIKEKLKTVEKELHETKESQVEQIRDMSEKLSAMGRDLSVSRLQNNQEKSSMKEIVSQEWVDSEGEDYPLLNFNRNNISTKKPAFVIGKMSISSTLSLTVRIIAKTADISIGIANGSNKIYLDSTGLTWDGSKLNNNRSFDNGTYLTMVVNMDCLSVVWKIHNEIIAELFCEQLENREIHWFPYIDLGSTADSIAIISSEYS